MFESITKFFKSLGKKEEKKQATNSKEAAKERLHLVLMQDRANVSADFLELMKQEIIEVIKKYIEVDESAIDVRLTNKENEDGTNGAPALYANIPIVNLKNEAKKVEINAIEKVAKKEKNEKAENKKQDKENEKIEDKVQTEHMEDKKENEDAQKSEQELIELENEKEIMQEAKDIKIQEENKTEQQENKKEEVKSEK